MKTSPQLFQIENEETVWHTHKLLQETEKDIQLMKYRLKLLKRGDAELSKRIDQTKKKTKSMIELKMNHHEQTQQDKQKLNYTLKKQQEEQLEMIRKAMEQIKFEGDQRIKYPCSLKEIYSKVEKAKIYDIMNLVIQFYRKNIIQIIIILTKVLNYIDGCPLQINQSCYLIY